MKILYFLFVGLAIAGLNLIANSVCAQTLLYELESPTANQFGSFGKSVASVPDLDGDGRNDLIVGAPGEKSNSGRTHVFSGATGAPLYFIEGTRPDFGRLGLRVAGVPDLDGDGRGDLAMQERLASFHAVHVHSGATGAFLYTLQSPNDAFGIFGFGLAGVRDLNGDGAGEILVGAEAEDVGQGTDVGRAYLFGGATGSLVDTFGSTHKRVGGYFGSGVSGVPDTDGDGVDDLLVGAAFEITSGNGAGRAYLFSGATGALLLELVSPAPSRSGGFGFAVSGLNDVDGDGHGDLAVGAAFEATGPGLPHAGRVYVFSGATGILLHALESPNAERYGRFGYSISRVSDLDDDGTDDLLVGAFFENPNSDFFGAGRAYVFNGSSGSLLYELASPNEENGDDFGVSVAGLDDVDGDGRGDLLIGADAELDQGRAYVFSGGSDL